MGTKTFETHVEPFSVNHRRPGTQGWSRRSCGTRPHSEILPPDQRSGAGGHDPLDVDGPSGHSDTCVKPNEEVL